MPANTAAPLEKEAGEGTDGKHEENAPAKSLKTLTAPPPATSSSARNYLSATAGGSVNWAESTSGDAKIGTVSAGSTIEFGTSYYVISTSAVDLTAVPANGYSFKGWYTNWNSTSPNLISSSSSYTWTLPTDAGTTLTAAFEATPADPTVHMGLGVTTGGRVTGSWSSSGEVATIGGTGNYSFQNAGTISLTATADTGYTFKGWYHGVYGSSGFVESNDGTLLSSENTYTFSAAAGSSSALHAVFESSAATLTPISSVTVNVTPPAAGTTVGNAQSAVSVPAGANYSVLGLGYFTEDPTVNPSAPPLPNPATFPSGATVYIAITLQAGAGYMFNQASPYTAVTVNGATLIGGGYLEVTNFWDESTGASSWGNLVVFFTIPAVTHTVSFDMGGHYGAVASQTVEDGAKAARPADPARDANASDYASTGLHFHGWYNKPISQITSYTEFCYTPGNGGCIFDFNTPITQDTSVYAAYWGVLTVTAYDLTNAREQAGGSFDLGSYNSASTSNYAGVQTTAFYGLPEFLTARPAGGYTFAGWSTGKTKADIVSTDAAYTYTFQGNTTLYALFEAVPTCTYGLSVTAGGTASVQWGSGEPQDVVTTMNYSVSEGDTVTLTAAPGEGYRFKGWYEGTWNTTSGTEGYGFVTGNNGTLVSGDTTYSFTAGSFNSGAGLQAVFEAIPTYTVTVSDDGSGTGSASPASGPEGTEITLSAAPNEGFRFKEWQVVSGGVTVAAGKFTLGSENVEIKAVFELIPTYTVTFNTNGADTVPDQTVLEGGKAAAPDALIRENYVFDGWYRDAGLTTAFDFNTAITADTALYAKWSAASYVLTAVSGATTDASHTWTQGSGRDVVLTVKLNDGVDHSFAHFTGVQLDGKTLTGGTDYTAREGSTVVTLKAAMLQSRSLGAHTVTIHFDNGNVQTRLTVRAASKTPRTGDESSAGLWLAAAALSALGLGALTIPNRKRRASGRQ